MHSPRPEVSKSVCFEGTSKEVWPVLRYIDADHVDEDNGQDGMYAVKQQNWCPDRVHSEPYSYRNLSGRDWADEIVER